MNELLSVGISIGRGRRSRSSSLLAVAALLVGCGGTGYQPPPSEQAPDLGQAGPSCGNKLCEPGENTTNCCDDCGCGFGESCSAHQCQPAITPVRPDMAVQPDMAMTACAPASQACTIQNDCCDFRNGTGYCVDFGQGGRCADSCTVDSDCVSGCCQATQDGSMVCAAASLCERPLGSVCMENGDCASGLCVNNGSGPGWCSQTCASDASCPNSPLMYCALNARNVDICWRTCSTNSDCAAYGVGLQCKRVTTINGFTENLCQG